MRQTRKFVVEEHEEYGMNGLRPVDCPTFDPLTGMAVAHDMLEHPPGDTGEVSEELMAFGASLVTRYLGGYWSHQTGNVEENWDSDVSNILQYVENKGNALQAPQGNKGKVKLSDESLEEICVNAGKLMSVANEDWGRDSGLGDAEVITRWLRLGYRNALKRYSDIDTYTLCGLFKEIEKKADNFLEHAYIGQEVEITIDTKKCQVIFEEVYEEEEAY